jgi:hypothetical protein
MKETTKREQGRHSRLRREAGFEVVCWGAVCVLEALYRPYTPSTMRISRSAPPASAASAS